MNGIIPHKVKPLPTIPSFGQYAIDVQNLTFSYRSSRTTSTTTTTTLAHGHGVNNNDNIILRNLNIQLETGSRCLLIGANGSGKSTLLRILAGRHLVSNNNNNRHDGTAPVTTTPETMNNTTKTTTSMIRVLGLDAFHDTRLNFHRAYLDCDWGMRNIAFVGAAPFMADICVRDMMHKLQSSYPTRRDELIDILGIDLDNWYMHQLSDGQRRRVQIFLGLIRPFHILLLDEVTTSLDVCVRQDLLRWLIRESEQRGATIIYATHIFDGLDDWATHLCYLTNQGCCGWQGPIHELEIYQQLSVGGGGGGKMLTIAEHWLRAELDENRRLCKREKAHGAFVQEGADPTDHTQGGYGSGRMQTDEEIQEKLLRRAGRLSDMMGNSGVMHKVHRTAGGGGTS